jgi:hypothetical protein
VERDKTQADKAQELEVLICRIIKDSCLYKA